MKCPICHKAEMQPVGVGALDQCDGPTCPASILRCPECPTEMTLPLEGETTSTYCADREEENSTC